MAETLISLYEQEAAKGFGKQAQHFDTVNAADSIVQYKRARVREHVRSFLGAGATILELNAGTGEDALFFSSLGHRVHATDLSNGMLEKLEEKKLKHPAGKLVSIEQCSFNALENLKQRGPYDLVFSNFAGLNCTGTLSKTLNDLLPLVKPGGFITLVLMPGFCLWETLLFFKGKFRTAFRRLNSRSGAVAHVEGHYFRCWYYSPSYVISSLEGKADLYRLEGLCTLVPPSYLEGFSEKYPSLFSFLEKREAAWKTRWPWRSIGDYYILTLQKKGE
jgi:ubiquinone/menaquinone biosynthesis C-methylase UbiE